MIKNIVTGLRTLQAKTEEGEITWEVWTGSSSREHPTSVEISAIDHGRVLAAKMAGRWLFLYVAYYRGEDPETGVPVMTHAPTLQLAEGSVLAEGSDVSPLYTAAASQYDRVDEFWENVLKEE